MLHLCVSCLLVIVLQLRYTVITDRFKVAILLDFNVVIQEHLSERFLLVRHVTLDHFRKNNI